MWLWLAAGDALSAREVWFSAVSTFGSLNLNHSIPIPSRLHLDSHALSHALSPGPSAAFVPTDFFEIGADEVKSAVAWSKYVKVTVVKAKTRKNGNHGTTITFVFNYNHWTFFLIMAKNYSGGLGG